MVTYKRGELDNSNLFIREFREQNNKWFPYVTQTVNVESPLSVETIAWINGEQLHLADNGIVALTPRGDTTELNTQERGFFIRGGLLKETGLENAIACVSQNKYYLNVGSKLYILDGNQEVYNQGYPKQYECFVWDNISATLMWNSDGLWFGTSDGKICKFGTGYTDGNGTIVNAYWTTTFLTARKKMQLDTVRMIANADISWIMQKYNLRERAAYNWKNRAKKELGE